MIMPVPLFVALLGVAFCAWSASGNALNLCVTTGCSLFQDLTVGGISMWWIGVAGFGILALLALSGRPGLGLLGAGVGLVLDCLLLVLMLLTAPCAGCLVAALLFALTYAAFRQHAAPRRQARLGRSFLLATWTVLCIINIAGIARSALGTWPLYGAEDSSMRIYFSPSCSACREAIAALSGKANVVFFAVNEDDRDVTTIALMEKALARGATVQAALTSALAVERPTGEVSQYSLSMLALRFRLLCNKARVFAAGGQLPYFEFKGLPAAFTDKNAASRSRSPSSVSPSASQPGGSGSTDYALPIDTGLAGACGGANAAPCPE